MVNIAINNEKAAAREAMVNSVRDLLSLKIKIPLGNPNLKLVHTNQFLWTNLPSKFELANFEEIAKHMNSTSSRWSGYTVNRWYIETSTIDNNGKDFTMSLDVNPFASSLQKYRDDRLNFIKAYDDAVNSNNSSSSNNKGKTVKSVNSKTTSVPKRTDGATDCSTSMKIACNTSWSPISKQINKVESKRAMGAIGRKGTNYEKFVRGLTPKKAYKKLAKKFKYHFYYDNNYKCVEDSFRNIHHLNCGDASRLLKACMDVLDQPCVIYCCPGHYCNGVLINGKWKTVDLCYQSGRRPEYQTAGWNK